MWGICLPPYCEVAKLKFYNCKAQDLEDWSGLFKEASETQPIIFLRWLLGSRLHNSYGEEQDRRLLPLWKRRKIAFSTRHLRELTAMLALSGRELNYVEGWESDFHAAIACRVLHLNCSKMSHMSCFFNSFRHSFPTARYYTSLSCFACCVPKLIDWFLCLLGCRGLECTDLIFAVDTWLYNAGSLWLGPWTPWLYKAGSFKPRTVSAQKFGHPSFKTDRA